MTLLKDANGNAGFTFNTAVVKGGLDHGATVNERHPLSTTVTVEQRASVLAKDLAGNNLRVYTTGTGTTLATAPLTADDNGRFAGFVDAPDFDLYVTPTSGGAYTQRVRTSPPGVFHVNSYGAKPYLNNNAIGTVESQAGFQAAFAACAASGRGWGATVQADAANYLIGASIVPVDNVWLRGHGGLATRLYLKAGVNVPILDSTPTGQGGRYNMEHISFRTQNYLTHSGTFPLVRLQCYAATMNDIFISEFPSDGIEMTNIGSFAADTNTFQDFTIAGVDDVSRYGFYINNSSGFHIYGGLTVSCGVGLYVKSDTFEGGFGGQVQGYHFENIQRYSIYLQGATGVRIRDNYIFSCPVGLDKDSHDNTVQHNTLLSSSVMKSGHSMIYDGGRDNITTPNKGTLRLPVEGVPLDRLRPASLARDPDMSQRATNGFTATGGATLEKKDNWASSIRTLDRRGRLPLAIIGAANKGVQHQAMAGFTAGDTFELDGWWWSGQSASVVARAQWKIVDNGSSTVLFDSGALVQPYDATEWLDTFARSVFQVPAGTTDVRVEISTPDAGPVYVGEINFIRSMILNGGFEGAYAAGVAPNWAVTAGAGTPTEVGGLSGTSTKAQKLSVTAGQSLTLGQVVTVDEDSFCLMKCMVKVGAGGYGRARMGWGNLDLSNDGDSQLASVASARFTGLGVAESLSSVFRPSTFTRALIGLTSHVSEACDAVFDDFRMYPLKDVEGPLVFSSDEIDLTAASKAYQLRLPYRDMRLRRVRFEYSVAASAVGPTIRVGTPGTSNYYCNLGPGVNPQAVGDPLQQAGYPVNGPSRTDVRRGTPIVVTHSGAVANSGKGHVIVECE